MVDINVMLLAQTKGGKKTEIVFLSISLFFFLFYNDMMMMTTHTRIYIYIVRTGDLKACVIEKKILDEFSFLFLFVNTFLPIPFKEPTND
jgi:hypothetical protein